MPLLLDAGVLYALAAADDYWHVLVREFLKAERQSLLAPVTVIPKAAYFMRKRLGHAAHRHSTRSHFFAHSEESRSLRSGPLKVRLALRDCRCTACRTTVLGHATARRVPPAYPNSPREIK